MLNATVTVTALPCKTHTFLEVDLLPLVSDTVILYALEDCRR